MLDFNKLKKGTIEKYDIKYDENKKLFIYKKLSATFSCNLFLASLFFIADCIVVAFLLIC